MLRKLKYLLPVAMLVLVVSCKKGYLDINTDPNNPTKVEVSKLLPTAERNLGDALSIGDIGQVLTVYTHQLTSREEADGYGATGNNFYIAQMWPKLYEPVLNNLQVIINEGTTDENMRYVGIAKILKAYTFSVLVDLYGDVPFSEANQLRAGTIYAKFDAGKDIYPQLLSLIDEGIADLNNGTAKNALIPKSDDVIYEGSVTNWVKAANTIKLKLYTQIRLVQNVSTEVSTLISDGKLISNTEESFLLPYGPNGATDDRNPGYGDYFASQRGNFISPWFYEIMKGYNPGINTGITDPRIPYYFYNQLKSTQAPRENEPEYRDSAFVSVYFGSTGPNKDKIQQNSISVLGIYPVGGRYDEKDGIAVTGTSGTGAAPYRFITYADRLYLEAELIQAGVISGDARAKLKAAIKESFKQVDYVVKLTNTTQAVPSVSASGADTVYTNKVLAQYDAKPSKQLEIIMTEKWISNYGNSVDQYTDYRRTGFPVLFNPNDPTMAPDHKVQGPFNGNPLVPGAQPLVPVQLTRDFPLSLPWPTGELEVNPNAPAQKTNLGSSKVFWLP